MYRRWDFGEPNDVGMGEDCVVLKHDGLWNDVSCSQTSAYICERVNGMLHCSVLFVCRKYQLHFVFIVFMSSAAFL